MTVETGQATLPLDPQASLRTELVGQIVASQFALESSIAELMQAGGDPAIIAETRMQMSGLAELRQQIAARNGAALAGLRGDVNAAASASSGAVQQARVASASAASAGAATLAEAAAKSRAQVSEIMRGMKDFDPHLQFTSRDDEDAYRRREAERRAYVAQQHTRNTPEGDLNASAAAIGQMVDAKAHGAGDSPEFAKRWDELVASTERLREAAKANGVSTEAFDRHLREDLRRILQSKGLSDAQIDAQFAAHPDPLDAAKAYVSDGADIDTLRRSAERIDAVTKPASVSDLGDVASVVASLQSAGVVAQPHDAKAPPEHGVAFSKSPANTGRTV